MKLVLLLAILFTIRADFAVLTDVHYDQFYQPGAPTQCLLQPTGLGCCRRWSIGNGSASANGTIGCDSPKIILSTIVDWLNNQNIDRVIFLGDAVDHDLLRQNWTYNLAEIRVIASQLARLNVPVTALLGNHDSYLVDNIWDDYLGLEWLQTIAMIYNWPSQFGYWAEQSDLFINSLLYDRNNIARSDNLLNQTSWWKELVNNPVRYLFSHFGLAAESLPIYQQLLNLTNATAILAGHTHFDDIQLTEQSVIYLHPSVVPDQHYPEVRIYVQKNNQLIDYVQYGFLLPTLQPQRIYSARSAYNLTDLSRSSWADFLQRKSTNTTLEQIYQCHRFWQGQQCSN